MFELRFREFMEFKVVSKFMPRGGAANMNPFKAQNPSKIFKPHHTAAIRGDRMPSSVVLK